MRSTPSRLIYHSPALIRLAPFEVLCSLVHKGTDRRLPSGLLAFVVRSVKIWHSELGYKRFCDGRDGEAWHARKGIDIDDAVITEIGVAEHACDAETALGADVEAEIAGAAEPALELRRVVIRRDVGVCAPSGELSPPALGEYSTPLSVNPTRGGDRGDIAPGEAEAQRAASSAHRVESHIGDIPVTEAFATSPPWRSIT